MNVEPAAEGADHPGSGWRRRFWLIFVGQSCSLVGTALTQFVLMWWITATTGSLSALAVAGVAGLGPQALLSPFGGVLADRCSRRVVLIVSDAVSALCIVLLIVVFLTGAVELWHVYVALSVRGAAQAFQMPALSASTAMLVPEGFLSRAAGFHQTLHGLIFVVAAPLGAAALGVMPIGWALGIDVLTSALGILPLLIYRIPQRREATASRPGAWLQFREGLGFVRRSAGLRRLLALQAAIVLVVMPLAVLLPLLVKEHFGGGAPQVAVMEALWGGGMLAGGALVALCAPRRHIRWVLCGFATTCFAFALCAGVPRHLFPLALAVWAFAGLTFVLGNAPLLALLQTTIPNQMQGRVLSLMHTISGFAVPVGLIIATPVGEAIGIRLLFVISGVTGGLLSLAGFASADLLSLGERARRPQTFHTEKHSLWSKARKFLSNP